MLRRNFDIQPVTAALARPARAQSLMLSTLVMAGCAVGLTPDGDSSGSEFAGDSFVNGDSAHASSTVDPALTTGPDATTMMATGGTGASTSDGGQTASQGTASADSGAGELGDTAQDGDSDDDSETTGTPGEDGPNDVGETSSSADTESSGDDDTSTSTSTTTTTGTGDSDSQDAESDTTNSTSTGDTTSGDSDSSSTSTSSSTSSSTGSTSGTTSGGSSSDSTATSDSSTSDSGDTTGDACTPKWCIEDNPGKVHSGDQILGTYLHGIKVAIARDMKISRVEMYTAANSSPLNLTQSLRKHDTSGAIGDVLASASFPVSTTAGYQPAVYDPPLEVNAGDTIWVTWNAEIRMLAPATASGMSRTWGWENPPGQWATFERSTLLRIECCE